MKLEELKITHAPILEGKQLSIYEDLLPLLMLSEEGEGGEMGTPTETQPADAPPTPAVSTPADGGWGRGPFRPGGGMNGNHWFNEFYKTLKNLVVANNVLKRMGELGISKEGKKRIQMAAKVAARNVNLLLSNPGATAYKIPVWTFDKPKAPKIQRWNEGFAYEFKKELAKLDEQQFVD